MNHPPSSLRLGLAHLVIGLLAFTPFLRYVDLARSDCPPARPKGRVLPRPTPTGYERNAGQIRALGLGRRHARIPRRSSL